ncbi:MAG: phosphodiester glycosidase family protein [Bacilli bacterium]|nr:phosphodiester glycosidase family protein [Bacilli bacterium]
MFRKKKSNLQNTYKWPLRRKVVATLCILYIVGFSSFLFLFYGPFTKFKEFWITSAMTTMSHQYLATWLYSDSYIEKVLKNNSIIEPEEISNPDEIIFRRYTATIYRNEYEKEILEKDGSNDLYKVVQISGKGYQGFLVAIYDPSRIHIATTSKLGITGESILTVSERENAIIAMNAGGFYDPDWNSNGALPHGTVIVDGKIVSDYDDANMGGGFIGFTQDNKLVLGRMSKEEALEMGYRDAIEFGPYLIVNGKRSFIRGNGGWGIAPRSAIGQRKDGIVLFLVINGRLASSIGADMVDLTDIMERYGAYNAANLDGGSSSELVIRGQIVNTPVAGGENGLRNMSTFWVVK